MFGFHKMFGNSPVVEGVAATREELTSMELASYWNCHEMIGIHVSMSKEDCQGSQTGKDQIDATANMHGA